MLIASRNLEDSKTKSQSTKDEIEIDSCKINPKSLNGSWTLVCYTDLVSSEKECKSQINQQFPVSLYFNDDEHLGTITGHTSINQVKGYYSISEKSKIKIKSFEGTLIGGETKWGRKFWNTIRQSSSFKYNKDTLEVLYDNDKKSMKFCKTEDNFPANNNHFPLKFNLVRRIKAGYCYEAKP
jgi:hypothetical protein